MKKLAFEYHTLLHHSQTHQLPPMQSRRFEYHTLLHHSQTKRKVTYHTMWFEYHTLLHHSQTKCSFDEPIAGLNTILFYIILKHSSKSIVASLV